MVFPDPNRAKIAVVRDYQATMAGLRNYDLGGFMVNYQASPYVASKYVDLGVMGAGGSFIG